MLEQKCLLGEFLYQLNQVQIMEKNKYYVTNYVTGIQNIINIYIFIISDYCFSVFSA